MSDLFFCIAEYKYDVKFYQICHNREYTAYFFLWVHRPDKKDTDVFCKKSQ